LFWYVAEDFGAPLLAKQTFYCFIEIEDNLYMCNKFSFDAICFGIIHQNKIQTP